MKITNNTGLPDAIYNAISRQYHRKSDYSVTELLAPVQQVILKNKYNDEIVEDASERIWALMGSAMHSVLEKGADKNVFTEENLKINVLGKTISGSPDWFDGDIIIDYKFTSVWSVIYGSRDAEHEAQLNCYAALFKENGFDCKALKIVYILRDWSKTKAEKEEKYPKTQIIVKDFPKWPHEKAMKFIADKVSALIEAEKGNIPECAAEERWQSADVWAVMKKGRKSAVALCDTETQAQDFIKAGKGDEIVLRPGVSKRCEEYCIAAPFCRQYQEAKNV